MNYQEKLEKTVNELIENAFDLNETDAIGVVEAYGILDEAQDMDETYFNIGTDLGLDVIEVEYNEETGQIIGQKQYIKDVDTSDLDILDEVKQLLEEPHNKYLSGEIANWGDAQEAIFTYYDGREESEFLDEFSYFIDFENLANYLFRFNSEFKKFNGDYYFLMD